MTDLTFSELALQQALAEIERLRAALTEAIDLIDFISLGNVQRISIRDGELAKLRAALNPKESRPSHARANNLYEDALSPKDSKDD